MLDEINDQGVVKTSRNTEIFNTIDLMYNDLTEDEV